MLTDIMGSRGMDETAAYSLLGEAANAKGSSARISFQWGGSLFALILLVLNFAGRRSSSQKTLLVLFLFTSFPQVLFKFIRGQFGYWVAFLVIAANLFSQTFSVSPFLLLVITPDWIAGVLRNTTGGTVLCLLTTVLLVITEFREDGGTENCCCNFRRVLHFLCIGFLLFFTVEYLCLETWQ